MPPRKKSAVDRRVARTRAGLQHALITLIMKKGYDAITVEDICEAANIGRSTFYLHYASKDALKRSGLEHLRDELVERQNTAWANASETPHGFLRFTLGLFEHAGSHIDLYRAPVGGRGGGVSLDGIREILSELVRKELIMAGDNDEAIPAEFVVQYVVEACIAVLTWWLDRGAKSSAQKMDAMFRHLAMNGTAGLRIDRDVPGACAIP